MGIDVDTGLVGKVLDVDTDEVGTVMNTGIDDVVGTGIVALVADGTCVDLTNAYIINHHPQVQL